MNAQNTKNKILIYRMVKKYFSLDANSLKLFRERLFFAPHISPMYKRLMGESIPEDLRIRIPLNSDDGNIGILRNADEGFDTFLYSIHYNFRIVNFGNLNSHYVVENYSKTDEKELVEYHKAAQEIYKLYRYDVNELYACFRKNKITIDKKEYKLFKLIKNIFLIIIENGDATAIVPENTTPENYVDDIFQKIGMQSIPKNSSIQLVISLNFADWFLCSTGEDWSSCLNIYASEGFWTGLPGLIGDKNRAILYLTDGEKKNVDGIVTDRIIARRWMFTGRDKRNNNKEIFFLGKEYPIKFSAIDLLRAKYPDETFSQGSDNINISSRYYAENLFQEVYDGYDTSVVLADVYQDNVGNRHFSKKNKAKYFPKSYSHYNIRSSGSGYSPVFKSGSCDIDNCFQVSIDDLREGDTELKYAYRICEG